MNPEIRNKYEVVIGIECHVQLSTRTKLFCGCDNDSRESEPNIHVCQTCLGLPGTLPVLNRHAVELGLRLGHVLHSKYTDDFKTKFDRKNYFYPDLPKGYQITQFDQPVVGTGYVEFPFKGKPLRIGITRAHLEEDAGKLTHPTGANYSFVDLNRAGTPLLEVVSEPDMRSAAEAKAYAQELFNLVRYAKISEANLYYGNMRFDVNVSVRLTGQKEFGTRTETKNLNSFRAIERSVEYEVRRQIVLIEGGERIRQETRGWNDDKQETYSMRSKEDADEYRYFPEPDVPPLLIPLSMINNAREEVGLLPNQLRDTLIEAGIKTAEAEIIVSDPNAAQLWFDVYALQPSAKRFAFNWLVGDAVKIAEDTKKSLSSSGVSHTAICEVATLIDDGKLSSTNAKLLMRIIWDSRDLLNDTSLTGQLLDLAQEHNLLQQSNESELGAIIDQVILDNQKPVTDYKTGNQRAFGALVGLTMKATQGKGNPPLINKLLREKLDKSS